MRDIVATIQREQDEAIRSPGSGVTIVSGGPGTGKTAVALHRAAYLLYSDRSRYAGGGILVVGPSTCLRGVHRLGAALARRGDGHPALARLALPGHVGDPDGPAGGGGGQGVAADAPGAGAGGPGRRAGRARPSCGCSTGAQLLRLERRELDGIRDRALPRGARRNEVRRAGFDGVLAALYAQARQLRVGRLPEQRAFEDEIIERPEFREFLQGLVAPAAPPARAGLAGPAGAAAPVRRRHPRPAAEIRLLTEAYRSAGHRRG